MPPPPQSLPEGTERRRHQIPHLPRPWKDMLTKSRNFLRYPALLLAKKWSRWKFESTFWSTFAQKNSTTFFSFAGGIWTLGCSKQGFWNFSVSGTRSGPFQVRYLLKTVQKGSQNGISKKIEKWIFIMSFHGRGRWGISRLRRNYLHIITVEDFDQDYQKIRAPISNAP